MIPLGTDPDQDPSDPAGLQTLCRSCHIAKTRTENTRPMIDDETNPIYSYWTALRNPFPAALPRVTEGGGAARPPIFARDGENRPARFGPVLFPALAR